ncbi:hypothetical protein Axi01nite_88850 [Actinoplanes xinjiangensis]|nr:hypothetical protein Axi01nite_88850 [Actinoplanes xinjiangensis]
MEAVDGEQARRRGDDLTAALLPVLLGYAWHGTNPKRERTFLLDGVPVPSGVSAQKRPSAMHGGPTRG